jgi:tetratricopeptide (TPR) repeat protein
MKYFVYSNNKEGISRAYENIGRVYARNGKYKEALQAWEKKLPIAETDMEKVWLYHEIGRCHLELGNYDKAIDNGKKSLDCAERLSDENSDEKSSWKLNSIVLIGQAKSKLDSVDELNEAIEYFEKAIDIAETQSKAEN